MKNIIDNNFIGQSQRFKLMKNIAHGFSSLDPTIIYS
jgi:hypothetical protein